MKARLTVFIGLGIVLGVTSCATSTPLPTPPLKTRPHERSPSGPIHGIDLPPQAHSGEPSVDPKTDAREYAEIHKLYSTQAYDQALPRMAAFEKHYPKSPLLSQVENLHGLSLLLTQHADQAVEHFKNAVHLTHASSPSMPYFGYNLAKAQYESGSFDEADQTAAQISSDKLDTDNRIKFHFLRAGIYNKRKLNFEAAKETLNASRLVVPMTAESRKNFETSLDASLLEIAGSAQIEDLFRENENSPLADSILYRLGMKELTLGLTGKGEGHLNTLLARFPESAYAAQARAAVRTTETNSEVDRKAIGVLLPLKGKYARFGQKNLQAIEQAFRIFDYGTPDNGIHLVIEDAGDDAEQTIKALNKLANKHHVAAVIGPLLSKGIDQVTRRAEELGVPMISLARHVGASGNYIVQGGLTLQMQAYEMARYAIESRGLRRFAILYPKDKIGEEASQHFWDAVESLGGEIVGIESYTPTQTDFRTEIDKLSGLYYTEARSPELENLARLRRVNQIKKRNRKTEQYFGLTPLVDYEAVFIPDESKVSGLIMPTFAYRDVDHVIFLGTSAWSSSDLIQRAQNHAEGALFVDAFFPASKAPRTRKFVDSYHDHFASDPTAMDAIAYDAGVVLREAIEKAGSSYSRSDLAERLKQTQKLRGVTGDITYKDGQLMRDLRVLTIQGGQVVEEGSL